MDSKADLKPDFKADFKTSKGISVEGKKPQIISLLSGIVTAYAITCIVFIGYAMLITYTSVTEQNLPLIVTITSLASVIVAGFDAARGADNKGWLWGIAAGLTYAVIFILLETWANKGPAVDTRTVTIIALSLAGGGLGGVVGINIKK